MVIFSFQSLSNIFCGHAISQDVVGRLDVEAFFYFRVGRDKEVKQYEGRN